MKIAITGASGKTGYRITEEAVKKGYNCLLYTSPSPRDPE